MKKLIQFLLFSCIVTSAFSQSTYIIRGKIFDEATKQPLQAASVFAQNTTIGTATDAQGNFKLELPNGGYDLAVTFTGYHTESRRVSNADAGDKVLEIGLKQKEKEMADVVVKNTYEVADGWEKYGDFFVENFIGKTPNSKQCVLKNKEVLKFFFYKRRNRLKVLATEPLEIVNNALGYKIKYTLDSFTHEYNTQLSTFSGYPLFEEIQPSSPEQKMQWDSARTVAYKGSILHFMRSLYHKKLKEQGFEIQFLVNFNDKENAVPLKDFYGALNYKLDDSTQVLEINPNQIVVAVLYKNEKPDQFYLAQNPDSNPNFELSILTFLPNEVIAVEQNGYYYDQNDITISNYWAWEKAGDMLPYDYVGGGQ
ncbi:MAG TPA: carboxypeptidase-like regulatory domain-containing protein [Ferruginibacter sp.]|nr:carboxypeptidase-like regulatory domain-containing protein [Ferruginibacter sp.]